MRSTCPDGSSKRSTPAALIPLQRQSSAMRWLSASAAALVVFGSATLPAAAQQTPTRPDSTPVRPDYKSIDELLAALPKVAPPVFDETRALWLGALPLGCVDRLQPRTTARGGGGGGAAGPGGSAAVGPAAGDSAGGRASGRGVNTGANYFWVASYRLVANHNRTRAFWGCTDWHSAASSMWVTVRLLKDFPRFGMKELSREKLADHLGKSNLDGELAFFQTDAGQFERPYGYAWLLKLQSELRTWPDSQAKRWAANVAPLASWMADSLAAHITALRTPVRTGTQANTALSIHLALDYADAAAHVALRRALVTAARRFYLTDRDCNTLAEAAAAGRGGAARGARAVAAAAANDSAARGAAAGADARGAGAGGAGGRGGGGAGAAVDVLSPCLSEAALMARVLEPAAFVTWVNAFLPPLQAGRFAPLTEAYGVGAVGAERARLSALAFQRAHAMERIARALPAADPRVVAWHRLSALHADRGFELLRDDATGTHWVPAYALLYLAARN